MQSKAPKCPLCRWMLAFRRSRGWEAWCWNPHCPVRLLPASFNSDLVEYVRERGEVRSKDVSDAFDWKIANTVNQLTLLTQRGLLERRYTGGRGGLRWRIHPPLKDPVAKP